MKVRVFVSMMVVASLVPLLVPVKVAHAALPEAPLAASGGFPFGEPDYDSGWRDITAGGSVPLSHNLGGDASNYVVDLQGRGDSGDTHSLYGGDRTSPEYRAGFFWLSLTSTGIRVGVRSGVTR